MMSKQGGSRVLKADERVPRLALKPAEAADALGISERTLWALTKSGRVPFVREGRCVIYPVHMLQQWMSRRAKQDAARAAMDATEPACSASA